MSEEKKCIKNEEFCEDKRELSVEELEHVSGGDESTEQNKEPGLKGFRIHGIEWNG